MPLHAAQRRLLVRIGLLFVGHEAVEIDIRPDLLEILAIEVLGVDLKDLDNQRVDVLHVDIQSDWVVGTQFGLVRIGEIEVDPVLELLVHFRRKHRVEFFGVPQAVDDLRLGKDLLEILIVDVRRVGRIVVSVDEEVLQIASHERLVVADNRQHRRAGEILLQVGGMLPPLERLHVFRRDITRVLRQLDVLQESLGIEFALRAIEHESMIKNVGFE